MDNTVIFYTQIISIVAFVITLFTVYRTLVSNKDSLIELQKEQIKYLGEKIKELEQQSPDALAESLSIRVERQLAEIERLKKDQEDTTLPLIGIESDVIVQAVKTEIKDWKDEINKKRIHKWAGSANKRRRVTGYLGSKTERKKLYAKFIEKGGTPGQWTKVLSTPVDDELYDKTIGWTITQWREFVFSTISVESPNKQINED